MRVLLVLLLCGSVSACLVTGNQSRSKKLHEEKGYFKMPSQVKKEEKKQRKEAEKSIKNLCGKALDKRGWIEDARIPNKEHFLAYFTKSKSCDDQVVMINLKAAQFMQAKSITCSLTDDSYLRFEIPQSPSFSDRIRVDCDSQVIDIRSDGSSLSISTMEKNGSANLAVIDSFGKWNNKIEKISQGLSMQDLNKMEQAIIKANDDRGSDDEFLKRKFMSLITFGLPTGAASWFTFNLGVSSILLAAGAVPVVITAAPYVALFSLGYVVWAINRHMNKKIDLELDVPELSLMHNSIGKILADFKS